MSQTVRRTNIAIFAIFLLLASCGTFDPPRENEQGGTDGSPDVADTVDDNGPVGSAGRAILAGEEELTIEIAVVEGRDPSDDALAHLESTLEDVSDRPVTIQRSSLGPGDGVWTSDEVRAASGGRKHKSSHHSPSIWIGYLDGRFAERNTLGVAAAATVAAIFPDQINTLSTLLQPGGIERSVLVHELGHLLGLVNIGYQSDADHEDPEHPNHSNNRESVMFWAVEDISVAQVFEGGPPAEFDQNDKKDLEKIKSSS